MSSTELFNQTSIKDFIEFPKDEQHVFLNRIKINELKEQSEPAALKKFVAMKILAEARFATEDKSLVNLTAQFRNLLAFFGCDDVQLKAENGQTKNKLISGDEENRLISGNEVSTTNGYRLFHTNDMGRLFWNRKFFNIGVDENNNIITKKINKTTNSLTPIVVYSGQQIWDKLDDSLQLKNLFNEIKKESAYENTLAYDLLCVATFCAASSILIAHNDVDGAWQVLSMPLALAISAAIFAVIVPPVFVFFILEHLIINPIKWAINVLQKDEYEEFIDEVCRSPSL